MKKTSVGAVLFALLLTVAPLVVAAAGPSSIHTTDSDFNGATLTNMTVSGSGTGADVVIGSTEANETVGFDSQPAGWSITRHPTWNGQDYEHAVHDVGITLSDDTNTNLTFDIETDIVADPEHSWYGFAIDGNMSHNGVFVGFWTEDTGTFGEERWRLIETNNGTHYTLYDTGKIGSGTFTDGTQATIHLNYRASDGKWRGYIEKDGTGIPSANWDSGWLASNHTISDVSNYSYISHTNDGSDDIALNTAGSRVKVYSHRDFGPEHRIYVFDTFLEETGSYPAEYLNNHTIDNSESGFVDITTVDNATVDVTFRGDSDGDGVYEEQLNQTTGITTSGNDTYTWSKFSGSNVQANITVTDQTGISSFVLASEGVTAASVSGGGSDPRDHTQTFELVSHDLDRFPTEGSTLTVWRLEDGGGDPVKVGNPTDPTAVEYVSSASFNFENRTNIRLDDGVFYRLEVRGPAGDSWRIGPFVADRDGDMWPDPDDDGIVELEVRREIDADQGVQVEPGLFSIGGVRCAGVRYWDPSRSTTELDYAFNITGTKYDAALAFDEPIGYHATCVDESWIDENGVYGVDEIDDPDEDAVLNGTFNYSSAVGSATVSESFSFGRFQTGEVPEDGAGGAVMAPSGGLGLPGGSTTVAIGVAAAAAAGLGLARRRLRRRG